MKNGGFSTGVESKRRTHDQQYSGALLRPIHAIHRSPINPDNPRTDLERYKLALRKHRPVDRGLPWPCQSTCPRCRRTVPSQFVYDEPATAVGAGVGPSGPVVNTATVRAVPISSNAVMTGPKPRIVSSSVCKNPERAVYQSRGDLSG